MKKIYFFILLLFIAAGILFNYFEMKSKDLKQEKNQIVSKKKINEKKKITLEILKVYYGKNESIMYDTNESKRNVLISDFSLNKTLDSDLSHIYSIRFSISSVSEDKKWMVSSIEIGDMSSWVLLYIPEKLIVPEYILPGPPAGIKRSTLSVYNRKNNVVSKLDINKLLQNKNKFSSIDKWRKNLVEDLERSYIESKSK